MKYLRFTKMRSQVNVEHFCLVIYNISALTKMSGTITTLQQFHYRLAGLANSNFQLF